MEIQKKRPSDEIPTSSMADIAFLLIIYFMITATFAATRGLDFTFPKDENSSLIEVEESVLIEIQSNGQLVVDRIPMPRKAIFEYLKPKLASNPRKPVILKPLAGARYGEMVSTFDALRKIKIKVHRRGENRHIEVYQVDLEEILEAAEKGEELGLDVNVSIPTQREIESVWGIWG